MFFKHWHILQTKLFFFRCWDCVVGVLTRLTTGQLRNCGSFPSWGKRLTSSENCLDWLWGPPNLLFDGYLWLFLQVWSWPLIPVSTKVKNGAIPPLHHAPSWCVQKQLYRHQILFINIYWLSCPFSCVGKLSLKNHKISDFQRAYKVITFSIGLKMK